MDYDPKEGWDVISKKLYYLTEENRLILEIAEHQKEKLKSFKEMIDKLRESGDLPLDKLDIE